MQGETTTKAFVVAQLLAMRTSVATLRRTTTKQRKYMPTIETKEKTPAKAKAKKAPAAPAPIIPVSAELNIEVNIFDTPQNNMRGFAIASDTVKGKFVRFAHSYFWTDKPAELTLDKHTRSMGVAELRRITEILNLFAKTLEETDASR